MRRLRRSSIVLLALALVAPRAYAQTSPASPSTAEAKAETKVHFQRGVKLYSEEDYRGALVEFKRAYDLSQNPNILYNLGQTHFQLRDYASALQAFEKYLATGGSQITAARRQSVEKDLEDLRGRIAKVTIEASVPGAEISIDDVVIGKAPLSGSVVVSAGMRKVSATKEGFVTAVKNVEVASGDAVRVKLELVASTTTPETAIAQPPPPGPTPPAQSAGIHPMVFVGYGVAIVGVGVGATFGVIALGTKSDLDARCVSRVCPTDAKSKGDSLTTQATISTIGLGVGLVGAVVGTYFAIAGRGTTAPATTTGTRTVTVTPWIAGTSAGLSGRF